MKGYYDFLFSKAHATLLLSMMLLCTGLISYYYKETRESALSVAENNVKEFLRNISALRHYVSDVQKEEVYKLQDEGFISRDYFRPELLSSTFSAQATNGFYNHLRKSEGLPEITIKFPSPNARNPKNDATPKEKIILDSMNKGEIYSHKEVIDGDDGKMLYYAVPTRRTIDACMRCHTEPELAPKGLVDIYGIDRGFYEKKGEIRALLTTLYPLDLELKEADAVFWKFSLVTLFVFTLIYGLIVLLMITLKRNEKRLATLNASLEERVEEQTKELREKEGYLNLIYNSTPDIIVITTGEVLVDANSHFFEFFSDFKNLEEFRAKHECICEMFEEVEKEGFLSPRDKKIWVKKAIKNDISKAVIVKEGYKFIFKIKAKEFNFSDKNMYVATFIDITELELLKDSFEELSAKDPLTGLLNRRSFVNIGEKELKRAKRDERSITLAMIDIDFFKEYNDTYGHGAGDIALIKCAASFASSMKRGGDHIFRLGGEEFAILFENRSGEHPKEILERLRVNIESLKIPHIKSKVSQYLTVSVGFVSKRVDEDTLDSLLSIADKNLYRAKSEGRNRVV